MAQFKESTFRLFLAKLKRISRHQDTIAIYFLERKIKFANDIKVGMVDESDPVDLGKDKERYCTGQQTVM